MKLTKCKWSKLKIPLLDQFLTFWTCTVLALTLYLISDPIHSLFLLKLITSPDLINHFSAIIFLDSINKPLSLLFMQRKHPLKHLNFVWGINVWGNHRISPVTSARRMNINTNSNLPCWQNWLISNFFLHDYQTTRHAPFKQNWK